MASVMGVAVCNNDPAGSNPAHRHPNREDDMSWQPIETAPIDEWILAYEPEQIGGEGSIIYVVHKTQLGSRVGFFDGEGYWQLFPTHWMPLPEPPEIGE